MRGVAAPVCAEKSTERLGGDLPGLLRVRGAHGCTPGIDGVLLHERQVAVRRPEGGGRLEIVLKSSLRRREGHASHFYAQHRAATGS